MHVERTCARADMPCCGCCAPAAPPHPSSSCDFERAAAGGHRRGARGSREARSGSASTTRMRSSPAAWRGTELRPRAQQQQRADERRPPLRRSAPPRRCPARAAKDPPRARARPAGSQRGALRLLRPPCQSGEAWRRAARARAAAARRREAAAAPRRRSAVSSSCRRPTAGSDRREPCRCSSRATGGAAALEPEQRRVDERPDLRRHAPTALRVCSLCPLRPT